jgi:hypothetical protein
MEQKHKPEVKVKPKKEVRTKPNRVYGKDWLFSGQSKGFPKLLDIRYEKDLKFQKSQKKKRSKKGGKIKKSKRGGKVK